MEWNLGQYLYVRIQDRMLDITRLMIIQGNVKNEVGLSYI